jgi:acyl-coenzyme A synthetase/AMP-(fatty) acid ligase
MAENEIEFLPELPQTAGGKIRRVEWRRRGEGNKTFTGVNRGHRDE